MRHSRPHARQIIIERATQANTALQEATIKLAATGLKGRMTDTCRDHLELRACIEDREDRAYGISLTMASAAQSAYELIRLTDILEKLLDEERNEQRENQAALEKKMEAHR